MDASLSAGHRHGQLHRQSLNPFLGVGKVKALVEPGPDEGQENPVDGRGGNGNRLGGLDQGQARGYGRFTRKGGCPEWANT